jgi:uncharacterized protein YegJ (DUF2314 family)
MTNKIFFAKGDSPKMLKAFADAQSTFKYLWRELYWEYRRIVPALDVACVKVAFSQQIDKDEEPVVEHMWINDIMFDGEEIKGTLVNTPGELTNIENGDEVTIPLNQISDWLFACAGKTYGGFTIQAMRSDMNNKGRKEHDEAWGLDFGDYNDILVVYEQKEHPENLIVHPMNKHFKENLADYIKQNPAELTAADEFGYTILHRETIAGNLTSVEVLLSAGADTTRKTNKGKTALDFAKQLNWEHIIPLLEK